MTGSLSGFNTALSALRFQQVALDIASTNIANSTTDGYVRRRVVGETVGAPAQPAMWSRSDEVGSGVRASGVDRMVDPFLDLRARSEHGRQSYLDLTGEAMARVETGFAEPGGSGVSAAFAGFRSSLHDLVNAPGSVAARSQVLAAAGTVADAIQLQARNLADEADGQRVKLVATVGEVNVTAADLAQTNRSIAIARINNVDDSTLLDSRDRLALRLSELTGAKATIRPDGGMDVTVGGTDLVTGQTALELRISQGVAADGSSDGNPIGLEIGPAGGAGTAVAGPVGGEIGAAIDLLDDTLPTYAAGLDAIAAQFADELNDVHEAGYDLSGNTNIRLFDYDTARPAATLKVLVTDPAQVAASQVPPPGGNLDAKNAEALIGAIKVEGAYQRLVTGFGTTVDSVRRLAANQTTLTQQVDTSREQLAGVSLDEETVNMLTAQRAYEAAARVMTTVDSVLDTLINRTGLR